MSDKKNVVFRNAIGGYNKSDVNSYLIKITEDFGRKEKELHERLDAAEKAAPEANEKLSELNDKFEKEKSELTAKIAALEAKAEESKSDLQEKNNSLEAELNAKKDEIENLLCEIKSLKEENESLKNKNDQAEKEPPAGYEETLKKARMYEKTSANIGDVIISANRTADEIIAAAKESARLIYEKSERAAEERKREIEETSKRILDSTYEKFKSAALESREAIKHVSDFSRTKLETVLDEISEAERNAAEKLEDRERLLWQSIKNDINTFKSENGAKK